MCTCVCKCYPPLIVWGLFGYGHQLLSQYVCVCVWVYGHVTVCRVANMVAQTLSGADNKTMTMLTFSDEQKSVWFQWLQS